MMAIQKEVNENVNYSQNEDFAKIIQLPLPLNNITTFHYYPDNPKFWQAHEMVVQEYIRNEILVKGAKLTPADIYFISFNKKGEIIGVIGITPKFHLGELRILDEEIWFDWFENGAPINSINVGRFCLSPELNFAETNEVVWQLFEKADREYGPKTGRLPYMITYPKTTSLFKFAIKRKFSGNLAEFNRIKDNLIRYHGIKVEQADQKTKEEINKKVGNAFLEIKGARLLPEKVPPECQGFLKQKELPRLYGLGWI